MQEVDGDVTTWRGEKKKQNISLKASHYSGVSLIVLTSSLYFI